MFGMRFVLVALVALVAPVALAVPSFADITVKSIVAGKGTVINADTTSTTLIKGNKMRSDMVFGDTVRSSIFDLDAQKIYSFDSRKKEADVYDMQKLTADMSKSVQVSDMKASVKPSGKTKSIAGKTANGYDMEISVPATFGGQDGIKVTVRLTGPMWIVKGAPGTAEYLAFYKNALQKGWFFTDPKSAKAQPGPAKAMAEVYRHIAAAGGIAYETALSVTMIGEGPMAAMLEKFGNITMTTTVTSVNTGALAADLFAPPTGYKLKEQK